MPFPGFPAVTHQRYSVFCQASMRDHITKSLLEGIGTRC